MIGMRVPDTYYNKYRDINIDGVDAKTIARWLGELDMLADIIDILSPVVMSAANGEFRRDRIIRQAKEAVNKLADMDC